MILDTDIVFITASAIDADIFADIIKGYEYFSPFNEDSSNDYIIYYTSIDSSNRNLVANIVFDTQWNKSTFIFLNRLISIFNDHREDNSNNTTHYSKNNTIIIGK